MVKTIYKSIYNSELNTLSFVDLHGVDEVKEAVDAFAEFILTEGTSEDNRIKIYKNQYYDSLNQSVDAPFAPKLEAVKYWTAYYNEPIYYDGSYGSLKDLGFMMFILNTVYDEETWPELKTKIEAVQAALDTAIIACWRDGYQKPTYYKNEETVESHFGSNNGLGLTINCSVWVPGTGSDGKQYSFAGFADWYKNELAFGKDCENWTALIQKWFSYTGEEEE